MKRLMLGAAMAIAMACVGPAAFAGSGPSIDKEVKAPVLVTASAEMSGVQHIAPGLATLDVIDTMKISAEKRSGKSDGKSRADGQSAAIRSARSHPLLL